jgi:hypothetical protein
VVVVLGGVVVTKWMSIIRFGSGDFVNLIVREFGGRVAGAIWSLIA